MMPLLFLSFIHSLKKLGYICEKDKEGLKKFITSYINDSANFSESFLHLIQASKSNIRLYKLFFILGIAARLYPLAIRLYQRGILFDTINNFGIDLLYCLEVCDVRIYKNRNTDPAKAIGDLSHQSATLSVINIANGLRDFTKEFMHDSEFNSYLEEYVP